MKNKKRWWCSLVASDGDGRSIIWPPPEGVLGYWISGHDSDNHATVCLWVEAKSETAVRKIVEKGWPELKGNDWRFFDERAERPSDRFPPPVWAVEMGRWPKRLRTTKK